MSWRKGSQLFREMWPLLQSHIPQRAERQEFLQGLLAFMLDWDLDADDIADLHPDVRAALTNLGVSAANATATDAAADDDVAVCVRQLGSASEKDRATAAQAIEFFVSQAENSTAAGDSALRALVGAMKDSSVKVRRAAAKSIDGLLASGHALPNTSRKAMEQAANDDDEQVKKRVAAALKRVLRGGRKSPNMARR